MNRKKTGWAAGKKVVFVFLACCLFAFTGCRHNADEEGTLPPGSFWAQRMTDDKWYPVAVGDPLAVTEYCEVYVAKDQQTRWKDKAQSVANEVANEFESKVYNLIVGNFGGPSDVDKNGKITILLLDIIDGYSPSAGGSYIAGYFHPYHSLSGPAYPRSNNADMIFMDTNPGDPGTQDFNMTLAHEFQHLVNFNRTYIEGGQNEFDTWINEGLSSAAEYLYLGGHVKDKITHYKDDREEDIRRGVNFVTWTPSYAKDAYSSYATVYLFFQWLRIHAGTGVYKQIFKNPNMDAMAIPDAVRDALGNGWPEILQNWFEANYRCDSSGIYGYKGDSDIGKLSPKSPQISGGATAYKLSPGEGIYMATTQPAPSNTRDIAYKKLDPHLLVLNTNVNEEGKRVDAAIPAAAYAPEPHAASGVTEKALAPSLPEKPRPIDRLFRLPK
ncbi:MAG: hypothetical protein LBQ57_05505 [Spirochaetales bacterium]|jgi:hypothetical protein|nr:hypothetical protein [Spirochaetales bacterium]